MNELDALLAQPLPHVADDGFSDRVMLRVEQKLARQAAVNGVLVAACAAIGLAFLPWHALLAEAARALPGLIAQPGIYIGAAALVLTLVYDRLGSRA